MADLTITAANVAKGTGANTASGISGATITAGQPLYQDATSNNQLKPAKADTLAHSACVGVALHASLSGQPITYQTSGAITIGGTTTTGLIYCVSGANAGGVAPSADLTSGNFTTPLGVAISSTQIQLNIQPSGVSQ